MIYNPADLNHLDQLLAESRGRKPLPQSTKDAILTLLSNAEPLPQGDAMKIARLLATSAYWPGPPSEVTSSPVDR